MNHVFLLHNPKAAGSALRALLASRFVDAEVAPVFLNSPFDPRPIQDISREFSGFSFYAGHYGFDAYAALANDHILVTNFRDPAARIQSVYRYWRNNVDAAQLAANERGPIELAQTLSFADFIRNPDPGLRLYIENFHFRQLLGSGWKARNCTILDRLIVRRRIARMRWFFIQEMAAVSLELLRHELPIYRGRALETINVSSGDRPPIAEADLRYLKAINRLDYAIYAFAVRLQEKRAASLAAR